MGWADPGRDIGWFARAAFEKGPEWMKGCEVPVCGHSISYLDLANQITAVTGIRAEYRQCSSQDFETRLEDYKNIEKEDIIALGKWLAIAPDNRTCYGTMEMEILTAVENELGMKALSWEAFLERTRWQGPPREH
jgi:hypothetical protein